MSSSPGLNMVKKGRQLVLLIHAFLSVLDAVHTSPSFISGWLSLMTSLFQFHPVYCLDLPGLLFLHYVFWFCFSLCIFHPFLLSFLPPIIKVLRCICLLWFSGFCYEQSSFILSLSFWFLPVLSFFFYCLCAFLIFPQGRLKLVFDIFWLFFGAQW